MRDKLEVPVLGYIKFVREPCPLGENAEPAVELHTLAVADRCPAVRERHADALAPDSRDLDPLTLGDTEQGKKASHTG